MIYSLPLSTVTLIVAALYLAVHLPGLFWPKSYMLALKKFPRNIPAGYILATLAGVWATWLIGTMDLGEFSTYQSRFAFASVLATILTLIFVRQFLAVRGLAVLLLLGVCVILDAAFLLDTPWRLLMVTLAYLWAVVGMILVASPYLMRDLIDLIFTSDRACRLACAPAVGLGLLLLGLALFVY
jgi:hypothetical protein